MFFKVVGRLTAGFFTGLGKFFFGLFRGAGKHPLATVLSLVAVAGVAVLLYATDVFGITNGTFLGGNDSAIVKPLERKAEPDGPSMDFLNGLKEAKASVLYNLLSPDYRALLQQRGVKDATVMQNLMNEKLQDITKQKGAKLNYRFTYIIGTRYSDGSVDDNYSGILESRTARANVEFAFKIKNGKITDIQTSEPVTTAALGTNKTESKDAANVGTITQNRSANAEQFMVGLTTYDADKIWEVLADSYKEYLTNRGITRDSMAKVFQDEVKAYNSKEGKNGQTIKYDGFAYFRSINFPNGISSHAYGSLLSVGDNPLEPNYTIVLDANNKVIRVGSFSPEDPIFSAVFGRGRQG